ncbi:hypothetical protein A2U01_0068625 [Trifolium medium]|uniref:Uncharacterized protein n=1 Tax=Trifolium medium TaxID=97028 RepID=A0A392SGS8_9FABA|nr:hypothetical protein [Trifolium medium]
MEITARDGRHSWVSFKQTRMLFKMFIDSVCGFKDRYYVVKPISQGTIEAFFETEFVTEEDGRVRLDEEGHEMTWMVARFPPR